MKSNDSELEKKIDGILQDLNFSEITKEPLSKSFDDFLNYSGGMASTLRINDYTENHYAENLESSRLLSEYKKGLLRFDKEMYFRILEWRETAEREYSKLLHEEMGISYKDIDIIKKPFYELFADFGLIKEVSRGLLKEFNINLFVQYKDNKVPVDEFFNMLKDNKCVRLSMLYESSVNTFIRIIGLDAKSSSEEIINKRFLEEVRIPTLKHQEGYINEDKMKQEFDRFVKWLRDSVDTEISHCRELLVSTTNEIGYIYSATIKKYSSLKEYRDKELGIKPRLLFSLFK